MDADFTWSLITVVHAGICGQLMKTYKKLMTEKNDCAFMLSVQGGVVKMYVDIWIFPSCYCLFNISFGNCGTWPFVKRFSQDFYISIAHILATRTSVTPHPVIYKGWARSEPSKTKTPLNKTAAFLVSTASETALCHLTCVTARRAICHIVWQCYH